MSKINIKVKITFSRRGRISCGIFLAFQIQRDSLKKTNAAAFSRIGSETKTNETKTNEMDRNLPITTNRRDLLT